jgi:pentatricopeptide repeat protein
MRYGVCHCGVLVSTLMMAGAAIPSALAAPVLNAPIGLGRVAMLTEARECRKQKKFDKALELFNEMIGKVSFKRGGPSPKDKRGWAFDSIEIRKEKAQLLEDMALAESNPDDKMKRWVEAVQEWIDMMTTFMPRQEPLPKNVPAAQVVQVAAKRALYFELYFEQKRCSVMAFRDLGTLATKGSTDALQQKFEGFAKNFVDLQSKTANPDLPQAIKKRIGALVASVGELKQEYQKLAP